MKPMACLPLKLWWWGSWHALCKLLPNHWILDGEGWTWLAWPCDWIGIPETSWKCTVFYCQSWWCLVVPILVRSHWSHVPKLLRWCWTVVLLAEVEHVRGYGVQSMGWHLWLLYRWSFLAFSIALKDLTTLYQLGDLLLHPWPENSISSLEVVLLNT